MKCFDFNELAGFGEKKKFPAGSSVYPMYTWKAGGEISLFYSWGNRDTEGMSDLSAVSQSVMEQRMKSQSPGP